MQEHAQLAVMDVRHVSIQPIAQSVSNNFGWTVLTCVLLVTLLWWAVNPVLLYQCVLSVSQDFILQMINVFHVFLHLVVAICARIVLTVTNVRLVIIVGLQLHHIRLIMIYMGLS